MRCYARNALVRVLHRSGDVEAARRILDEAEALARGKEARFFITEAAAIRAELDGVPLAATVPAPAEVRPVRAFAVRSSRRALAALVSGQDDERSSGGSSRHAASGRCCAPWRGASSPGSRTASRA